MSSRKSTAAAAATTTVIAAVAKLDNATVAVETTKSVATIGSTTASPTTAAATTKATTTIVAAETAATSASLTIDDNKSDENNGEMGANVSLSHTTTATTDSATVVVATPTATAETLAKTTTTSPPATTTTQAAKIVTTTTTPSSSNLINDEAGDVCSINITVATTSLQKTTDAAASSTSKCTRVTRHSSPMLLQHSPTLEKSSSSNCKKSSSSLVDDLGTENVENANEELNNSTAATGKTTAITAIAGANNTSNAGTTSTTTTPAPIIRGRKSLKDLKDAKEALAAALRAAAAKEEELTMMNAATAAATANFSNNVAKASHSAIIVVAAAAVDDLSKEEADKEENISIKDLMAKDSNIKMEEKGKEKELTEVNATTTPTTSTSTNRLTRKTHAERMVTNTRVTRNRRQSMTSSAAAAAAAAAAITAEQQLKSLTTTARGRRKKLVTPEPPATKRKRCIDGEDADGGAEPGAKYIKIEVKEATPTDDDKEAAAAAAESDAIPLDESKLLLEIKGEPNDSSDDIMSNASTEINVPTTISSIAGTTTRGRGRWHSTRNAKQQSLSPATRAATRQNKSASPAATTAMAAAPSVATTPVAAKRRRVGSTTRGNLLNARTTTTTASLLAAATANVGFGDEDSKDSLASSVDDVSSSTTTTLLMANEIKVEKLSTTTTISTTDGVTAAAANDLEGEIQCGIKKSTRRKSASASSSVTVGTSAVSPLSVDVATILTTTENDETGEDEALDDSNSIRLPLLGGNGNANSSTVITPIEKAASLSPELVSEGVNVISVKQFYKKPEFLENNLGIEQDPKLGEIVQKVSGGADETSGSSTLLEADNLESSMKEGELRLTDTSSADSLTLLNTNETQIEDAVDVTLAVTIDDDAHAEAVKTKRHDDGDDEDDDVALTAVKQRQREHQQQDADEGAVVAVKEDEEEEDAASEFNSMDNNCSLHEYAREDAEDDSDAPRQEDYDALENEILENEILEELAKEGVVDASGNPASCANANANMVARKSKHANNNNAVDEKKNAVELVVSDCGVGDGSGKDRTGKVGASNLVKATKNLFVVVAKEDEERTSDAEQQSKELEVTNKEENKENLVIFEAVGGDATPEVDSIEIDDGADNDGHDHTEMLTDTKQDDKLEIKQQLPVAVRVVLKQEGSEALDEKSKKLLPMLTLPNDIKLKHETITVNNKLMIAATKTSAAGASTMTCDDDNEELRRKQEQHLQNLGLLTHKAAEQVRQEFIQEAETRAAILQQQQEQQQQRQQLQPQQQHNIKRNGGNKGGGGGGGTTLHAESTGTLKTVIKLNRFANGGNSCTTGVATGTVLTGSGSSSTASTTALAASASTSATVGGNVRGKGQGGAGGNSGNGAASGGSAAQHSHGVRRQSLKMTFQKGRGRGQGNTDRAADQHGAHGEDAYYTIQNENEGATKTATTNSNLLNVQNVTHGRKSYSRSNSTATNNNHNHNISNNNNSTSSCSLDSSHSEGQNDYQHNVPQSQQQQQQHHHHHYTSGVTSVTSKKDDKEKILIPEKASSFKFHPGRLCEDQCYYCSGKFGLYDTPCHVGQIKSVERQQKILANEEKLTVDNCLCDACFRHVDRRANAAYKKRLSAPAGIDCGVSGSGNKNAANAPPQQQQNELNANDETAASDPTAGTSVDDAAATVGVSGGGGGAQRPCIVTDCPHPAGHSLRRKYIRKSVKKFLLNFEIPTGTPCVWLCQSHYDAVIQCSGCVLCKRRLGKNHMYHITSDTDRLEKALSEMGIPVQLGIGTAVCKLCRYFANLLMKPPDSTKSQKAEFVKNYRKRLLQFHNIHDASNDASEVDEEEATTSAAAAVATATAATALTSKTSPKDTTTKSTSDNVLNNELSNAAGDTSTEMLVDFYGPNDSNSSSHSSNSLLATNASVATAAGSSDAGTQMSKLKAILQQSNNAGVNNNSSTDTATNTTPMPSGSSKAKAATASNASDISNVLRANPNISMRELFHGEEELGLNFKVPFGCSSSQRTPEGWTRVQTFLQYDEPTRQLWEELQKPYGNQSSFLRHLILLEKYYRNGDLVLAPNASANASVYTKTVRQRLNSYDHGHCGGLTSVKPTAATASNQAAGGTIESGGSSKPEKNKTSAGGHHIPTVELNDDEDDDNDDDDNEDVVADVDENNGGVTLADGCGDDNTAAGADDDDDDDCSEVPITGASGESSNDDAIAVDKLTKQLSSNAVTIIARPKDANKQQTTSSEMLNESTNLAAAAAVAAMATSKTPNKSSFALKEISPLSAATPPLIATASSTAVTNSRSILKSNLLGINKSTTNSVEIVPLGGTSCGNNNRNVSVGGAGAGGGGGVAILENKQQKKILDVANKLLVDKIEAQAVVNSANNNKFTNLSHTTTSHQQPQLPLKTPARLAQVPTAAQLLNSPPELISLHRGRRSSGSGTAAATGASGSGTGPSSAAAGTSLLSAMGNKRLQLPKLPTARNTPANSMAPNILILPDTLSPQERQQSRSWRPTLLPVNDQQHHHLLTKPGPYYQTADGRRLPGLVQVQSGGRPYLISIFDYNRMCILRREKILRDQMLKDSKSKQQQQQQGSSAVLAGGGGGIKNQDGSTNTSLSANNNAFAAVTAAVVAAGMPNANKMSQAVARQQLHQLQQQQQKHHHQQQQQQQQQHHHHHHQMASIKNVGIGGGANPTNAGNGTGVGASLRYPRLAPKQQQQQVTMPPLGVISSTLGNAAAAAAAAAAAVNSASDNTAPWLWKNFPDSSNFLINGGATAGGGGAAAKLPHLLTKPIGGHSSNSKTGGGSANITATITSKQQQQQQQQFLESTIMTKIPKSLTVIPQHKLFSSASAAAASVAGANNNCAGQKE